MKIINGCLRHHRLFSGLYFCRFVWWRFLFTHVTYFSVFQWNSTMSSTTSNDVINVKHNWGCFLLMIFICLLVRKIYIWTFSTTPQYTFLVWKCMIIMRICEHCSLFHIIYFGINMTPMWQDCIFICFIYVMCIFIRPYVLSNLAFIPNFFKYLSRQDSNDESIILAEMQHSQPHMIL